MSLQHYAIEITYVLIFKAYYKISNKGAASVVSLAGDTTKAAVFINGSFFKDIPWSILIGTFLIMPFAVFAGRFVNKKIGAQAYNILFWLVMTGYTIRLLVI